MVVTKVRFALVGIRFMQRRLDGGSERRVGGSAQRLAMRGFSLSITSDTDGQCSIVLSDGQLELQGDEARFDEAWCSMISVDPTPDIAEILNEAAIRSADDLTELFDSATPRRCRPGDVRFAPERGKQSRAPACP